MDSGALKKNLLLGAATLIVAIALGWKAPDVLLVYCIEMIFFTLVCFRWLYKPVVEKYREEKASEMWIVIIFLAIAGAYLMAMSVPVLLSLEFVYIMLNPSSSAEFWNVILYPFSRLDTILVVIGLWVSRSREKIKAMGISPLVIAFERVMVFLSVAVFSWFVGALLPQGNLLGLVAAIFAKSILDSFSEKSILIMDKVAKAVKAGSRS